MYHVILIESDKNVRLVNDTEMSLTDRERQNIVFSTEDYQEAIDEAEQAVCQCCDEAYKCNLNKVKECNALGKFNSIMASV